MGYMLCIFAILIFYPQYFFDSYCQSANKRLEAYKNEFMKRLHREYNRQLLVSEVMCDVTYCCNIFCDYHIVVKPVIAAIENVKQLNDSDLTTSEQCHLISYS